MLYFVWLLLLEVPYHMVYMAHMIFSIWYDVISLKLMHRTRIESRMVPTVWFTWLSCSYDFWQGYREFKNVWAWGWIALECWVLFMLYIANTITLLLIYILVFLWDMTTTQYHKTAVKWAYKPYGTKLFQRHIIWYISYILHRYWALHVHIKYFISHVDLKNISMCCNNKGLS